MEYISLTTWFTSPPGSVATKSKPFFYNRQTSTKQQQGQNRHLPRATTSYPICNHPYRILPKPSKTLLLWTDSLDLVAVPNCLRASESVHNGVLLAIAEIILRSGIDLRVCRINGKENIRAGMLSRFLLDEYSRKFPADCVRTFSPQDLLPARWREHFSSNWWIG